MRRRQLYHAKHSKIAKGLATRRARARNAAANEKAVVLYDKPLPKDRKLASIEDKLKVLAFAAQLQKDKARANEILCSPRVAGPDSEEARATRKQNRVWAREMKKVNIEKECSKKFPLTVGKSLICKWRASAEKECWDQLPATIRARICATPNQWRQKLQLPLKGRKIGGSVPWALQKELDLLIGEYAMGTSDISERREVVTPEHVAT